MGNEPSGDDPLHPWQNQPTEIPQMTLEQIHQEKARTLQSKTRRQFLLRPVAPIVFSIVVFAMGNAVVPRVGCALAVLWTLMTQLPAVRRAWSRPSPADAAMVSGLEFYRRELEYRLVLFRQPWLTMIGPILLAIGSFLLYPMAAVIQKPAMAVNMVPFLVFMAAWVFGAFAVIRQQIRHIRLEIAELDALER